MRQEYDPLNSEIDNAEEVASIEEIKELEKNYIIRNLEIINYEFKKNLIINFKNKENQVSIEFLNSVIILDKELNYNIKDYVRAIYPVVCVDILLRKNNDSTLEGSIFWFSVVYTHKEQKHEYQARRSLKPDCLFAFRLANSIKTEFFIKNELNKAAHNIIYETKKIIVIDYSKGRDRLEQPDLKCDSCKKSFEVKSRFFDHKLRFSHSEKRPFWEENKPEDYNIIVFPDLTYKIFKNECLINLIKQKSQQYSEVYDYYIELTESEAHDCCIDIQNIKCRVSK